MKDNVLLIYFFVSEDGGFFGISGLLRINFNVIKVCDLRYCCG